MSDAKLVVVGGDEAAKEIPLKLPARLGRGRDNDIPLPHPLVSRVHCEIYERDGELFVRDLGSLNGTFVGSEQIDHAPLEPGQLLTVGTVTFRAIYKGYVEREAFDAEIDDDVELGTEETATGPSATTLRPPSRVAGDQQPASLPAETVRDDETEMVQRPNDLSSSTSQSQGS